MPRVQTTCCMVAGGGGLSDAGLESFLSVGVLSGSKSVSRRDSLISF